MTPELKELDHHVGRTQECLHYLNRDTCIVVNTILLSLIDFFSIFFILIDSSLDDETSAARWDELLKHFFEVAGNLLEGSFDRFILPLIQDFNKFFDRLGGLVQVFSTLEKLIPLFCEVIVLFESLLVDVGEFLETLVDVM